MAGDWIPIELNLSRKSEVVRIARLTERSKAEVVGLLVQFWIWASEETADGAIDGMDKSDLSDVIQGADEPFWDAMTAVGWLHTQDGGFRIPNADRWLTTGAKSRLESTRRKQVYRSRPAKDGTNVGQKRDKRGTKTGLEKRREEKRREYKRVSASADPCRPKPDQSADIRAVFDHYRTFHPNAHLKPVSTTPLWKKIRVRLNEGCTVADLKAAIDGCHADPWHQGDNDRNTKYLSLDLIVRDGSHIAKFIDIAKGESRGDHYSNAQRTDEQGRAAL